MLSKIRSGCLVGIEARAVDVEVDVSNGLPSFSVVGLPDTSIRESRDRIRSAIRNSGFTFPVGKITVNLSPANIKKEGAGFDLPIAVGILAASGIIESGDMQKMVLCGELSLNGRLRPFRGCLATAISFRHTGCSYIFPERNASEASHVDDLNIYGARNLREAVEHIKGVSPLSPCLPCPAPDRSGPDDPADTPDMKDVKGQEHAKRGLEIAACGGHNLLLIGPPGSGKSMLAKRFPYILPEMSVDESLESTNIHSIAGYLHPDGLMRERPLRAPHHTISYAAMAGGGTHPSPGEITLAHNGVLFLDEFPEFRRDVLETLRQPLESGEIVIARSERSVKYPSRFILVAAMNPCPCGYFTDPGRNCQCSSGQIQRYISKISGPLLDRIDIHLEVPRLEYSRLSGKRTGDSSSVIRQRVIDCRDTQKRRFPGRNSHPPYNAYMTQKEIETHCLLSPEAEDLLKNAVLELGMSARAYDKILKISRTIADMDGADRIEVSHLSESIGYRCLDRNLWV